MKRIPLTQGQYTLVDDEDFGTKEQSMKVFWVYKADGEQKAQLAKGEKVDVSPVGTHTKVSIDDSYTFFVPGNIMFEVSEDVN